MKKIQLLAVTLIALFLSSNFSFGQNDSHPLMLVTGNYELENNIDKFVDAPFYHPFEVQDSCYFRIIQFSETPSTEDKLELQQGGILLMDYLPKHAFLAQIRVDADRELLRNKKAESVVLMESSYKLSLALYLKKYSEWALRDGGRIELKAIHYSVISEEQAVARIEQLGGQVTMRTGADIISFIIDLAQLENLYSSREFFYFEEVDPPEEHEGYKDVSNHRSNYLNNPVGIGQAYDGTGVTIMMHDDGPIGPHIDYQGRTTTETSVNAGDHGDHVAGIIMGAGNVDQDGVGNAPGAHLLVYSSPNSNYNVVPLLYDNDGLVITSKSYGDGNNAGYTSLARQLDQQCYEHDALVHVFSAGNSGTSNFGYGAGAGWGNITGGHKQGKNVLAVGNTTDTDDLNNGSSRGPARDGRIKPDICAVGTSVYSTMDSHDYQNLTGTSMACPAVSGSLALLYQVYRELNGGQNPSAALINAIVLNTADDLGNPGPDFKHGWGRINVRRAYHLLNDNNYMLSEVSMSQVNNHTIEVPAGTKQVRIMVYWTDYWATPNANPALVNDLNMVVADPNSTVFLPLVLDPTPNAGILNQDAVPGIDDLNNVEQVTIDDPQAGTYTVQIEGFNVPQGPQRYVVVYEFVRDEMTMIFPIGGESLTPSTSELIRWDAVGDTDPFLIEYSDDAGLSWNTISSSAPPSWRSFPWTVPGTVTGDALVRITRGTETIQSKEQFSIIGRPFNLNIEWECPNSFNFSWNPVSGAIAYQVYLLGDYYMDSAGYTTETNATIYANSLQTQWVSVRAIGPNGAIGKRAIALEKPPGIGGCTLSDPVAGFTSICSETGPGSCVQFMDLSTNAGQGAAWEWTFPGGTPATSNLEQPVICYDTEGYYDVQLIVRNGVGEDSITLTNHVYIRKGEALPFSEDFEQSLIPLNWIVENDGNNTNWTIDANTSAYNIGSHSIMFNNFSNDSISSTSRFSTQQIDLSGVNSIHELSFDVAYAQGITANDSLRVYVTNDCGRTLNLIYSRGGSDLSTADPSASLFVPNGEQWRFEAVSLADFKDLTSVSFVFESYSELGNAVYVDNINLKVSEDNFPWYEITVFPNPVTDELQIAGLVEGESTTIRIHGANGQLVYENTFVAPGGTMTLNTSEFADGMYVIKIESDSKTHKEKLIKGDS